MKCIEKICIEPGTLKSSSIWPRKVSRSLQRLVLLYRFDLRRFHGYFCSVLDYSRGYIVYSCFGLSLCHRTKSGEYRKASINAVITSTVPWGERGCYWTKTRRICSDDVAHCTSVLDMFLSVFGKYQSIQLTVNDVIS